jgi:hypothetical protein
MLRISRELYFELVDGVGEEDLPIDAEWDRVPIRWVDREEMEGFDLSSRGDKRSASNEG